MGQEGRGDSMKPAKMTKITIELFPDQLKLLQDFCDAKNKATGEDWTLKDAVKLLSLMKADERLQQMNRAK